MTSTSTRPVHLAAARRLQQRCGDVVQLPGQPGYDEARTPWNVAIEQLPAAVARPRTVEQVRTLVRAAAAAGLRLTTQTTGHAAGTLLRDSLDDVVLVRTGALRGVHIDPVARIARVEAGASWADVIAAAAAHGLTALHGSAPDIGVAGFVLGGGLGWYGRTHGLACNSLLGAELVLADGEVVRADARSDAELFWGLRGGGGNFGIVVTLELRLLPIADVYAGMMLWPLAQAEPVVRAWARWCATAPEQATTSLRAMRFPPIPELPPFLRGREVLVLDGAVQLDDDAAAESLVPLRSPAPELDTFARVPSASLLRLHMDPEQPTPTVGVGAVLRSFEADAARAFLRVAGPDAAEAPFVTEIRHVGGALDRAPSDAGALDRIDGSHLVFALDITPVPAAAAAGRQRVDRTIDAFAAWRSPRPFLNFVERPTDPESAFPADTWRRLRALRRRVDPTGRFLAGHAIGQGEPEQPGDERRR